MKILFNKLIRFSMIAAISLFLFYCSDNRNSPENEKIKSNNLSGHQYSPVYNLKNVPVRVPFTGEIRPWKTAQLMVPFKSRIIASLAEPGLQVKKNDLLISLWQYTQEVEYTPLNLLAPFDGEITSYQFHVGDEVPAHQPLLTLHNYDYYTVNLILQDGHLAILKKWAKAYIQLDDSTREGYILDLSAQRHEVVIRFPGNILKKTNSLIKSGYIEAGMVSGTFMPLRYFKKSNKVTVMVEPHIEIQLLRVGIADTLAYIYPGIPDQTRVEVLALSK